MPYLQLNLHCNYPASENQRLAAKLSETYARTMNVEIQRVFVAIRYIEEGGTWRVAATGAEPVPVSMMMLEIERGRTPELHLRLAHELRTECIRILGVPRDRLHVRFIQPLDDDMYCLSMDACGSEWTPKAL